MCLYFVSYYSTTLCFNDSLTVEEHLNFYAAIRGMSKDDIKRETEKMLGDVNLLHKRNDVISSLSGGMKRKLSVAVAFTGNSKTVILDEPTAGEDEQITHYT